MTKLFSALASTIVPSVLNYTPPRNLSRRFSSFPLHLPWASETNLTPNTFAKQLDVI